MTEVLVTRWTAGELARRLEADLTGDPEALAQTVVTDSRDARDGALFFALDGATHRGAEFVPHALGHGATIVVVRPDWAGSVPTGRAVLRHPDPLAALVTFARSVRRAWKCPVAAITGSTGKTTVKEMTAHVLGEDRRVHRSPGNFNTVVGLARSILAVDDAPEVAVLEVGSSQPGEISRLAALVEPTVAAVTNVSAAHLQGLGDLDAVLAEKTDLLRAVPADGLRVVDGDDERLAAVAREIGSVLRVGLAPSNDLSAVILEKGAAGETAYRISSGEEGVLSVPGDHQVKNALFALALGRELGVDLARGVERLRTFRGVAGRMTVIDREGVRIIDDTYNANPASVAAALDWFATCPATGRKAVVLGDMLELGADSERYHVEVGRRVAELAPDLAVLVGPECRAVFEEGKRRTGDPSGFRHVPDSDEAARLLRGWVRAGDLVLVKGSRGMRMERVVRALSGESRDAV